MDCKEFEMRMTPAMALAMLGPWALASMGSLYKEPTPSLPAEVQQRKIADANNKRAKKAEKRARQAARNQQ